MYETGTATDFMDLAAKLNTLLTATGSAFGLTYVGTGTGTCTAIKGGATSVAESFDLTATSATNFTVVGTVSGSIGPATVGTPFSHTKIAFTLTAGGTAFVAGDKFTLATAPKWTQQLGPVTATSTQWRVNFRGSASSSPVRFQRVELALTAGGADQAAGSGGTATATGSTGSNTPDMAADTNPATYYEAAGTGAGWWQYTFLATKAITEVAITGAQANNLNGPLDFTIEYWSGSAWVIAGSFVNETAWGASERRVFRLAQYIWLAPGNDGAGQIYVGIHPHRNDAAGWYNWRLGGFTSYSASTDWHNQPGGLKRGDYLGGGGLTYGPELPLANGSMTYWFVVNGRRVMGVAKSGSTYSPFYLGLIAPYASPGQWPYPLFVGGALAFELEPINSDSKWAIGNTHGQHTSYANPFTAIKLGGQTLTHNWSPAMLRKPDGSWLGFYSHSDFYAVNQVLVGALWPYAYGFTNLKPDLDGTYSVMPIVLIERPPNATNVYGQFDGVQAVTGTSLTPEAAITIGIDTWIAFPDVTRSTASDYFAMKKD